MPEFWRATLRRRLSRRRVLSAAGASLAGGALLVACGGDDEKKQASKTSVSQTPAAPSPTPAPKDRSGLLSPITDDTKSLKRGGVLKLATYAGLSSYDVMAPGPQTMVARRGFSQLLRIKDGYLENTTGEIEGDAAASWEMAPDRLTLVLRLNPGAHFAPLPPTDGRSIDSGDVLASWQRYVTMASRRGELASAVSPSAPIVAMAAPDDKTVVLKLRAPDSTLLSALASQELGTLWMMAKESLDPNLMDPRRQALGTGPFYVSEGTDVFTRWLRNPAFGQDKRGLPYIDQIDEPVIADYGAQREQFHAGALYQIALRIEEMVPLKRQLPVLEMRNGGLSSIGVRFFFGQNPESPFRDERVRQAWVKTWDRDKYLDSQYEVSRLQGEGLGVATAWDTAISAAGWKGWWLDPRGAAFGPNASFFKYDIAEAKKLLAAAGFPDGVETELHHAAPGPASYPPSYFSQAEPLENMTRDSGLFRFNVTMYNYATEWTSRIRNVRGAFNGVAWWPDVTAPDPAAALFSTYNSKAGTLFHASDPSLDELTEKLLLEFDTATRLGLVQDIQRREGLSMFSPKVGAGSSFQLSWPALRNILVYQGGTNRQDASVFLDPDRAPLK